MDLLASIHKLPKAEKLRVMEFLWTELSSSEDSYISPQWHKEALLQTEERLDSGKEEILDWNEAKQALLDEYK